MRKANQARVRWLGSQIHHTTGKLYRVFNNIKNMVMLTPWDFVYGFEPVWASQQVFQLSQAVVDAIVSCTDNDIWRVQGFGAFFSFTYDDSRYAYRPPVNATKKNRPMSQHCAQYISYDS